MPGFRAIKMEWDLAPTSRSARFNSKSQASKEVIAIPCDKESRVWLVVKSLLPVCNLTDLTMPQFFLCKIRIIIPPIDFYRDYMSYSLCVCVSGGQE